MILVLYAIEITSNWTIWTGSVKYLQRNKKHKQQHKNIEKNDKQDKERRKNIKEQQEGHQGAKAKELIIML